MSIDLSLLQKHVLFVVLHCNDIRDKERDASTTVISFSETIR